MHRNKVGLFVGKFIAFHKGHEYYIRKFAGSCDKLNLILCGNTIKDRVPYYIRRKWLETDMKAGMPLFEVRNKIKLHTLIEDDITPYPDGLKEWCGIVQNLLGEKIDIMFGNDEYVRECALEFGSYYSMPDQERGVFNISSTRILDNGLKYYNLLTEVSKPYFNKIVLLLGPESTGKSTLAKRLAVHFGGKYIEEYGRIFEEQSIRRFNIKCTEWNLKDYETIALTQDQMIKEAMENSVKLLFIDTDALITQMYCELYLNKNSNKIDEIIKNQKFDLILYLNHQKTQWTHDGLRFLENERNKVDFLIKEKLKHYNREYIELYNDTGYDERFNNAINIIKDKFKM